MVLKATIIYNGATWGNIAMYELLIRIETLYLEAGAGWLVGLGAAALLVGLLFWLGGAVFSGAIIGLLGATVGAFFGLLVSQWFSLSPLLGGMIGAAVFGLAAFLFRNVIIIILAVIVFGLVSGTAYSSFILSKLPPLHQDATSTFPARSFSHMDPALRLNYINEIAQAEAGFFDRLNALVEDATETMTPYRWKLFFAVVAGGVVCLILIWLLRHLVYALCYSLIGTLLLFVGTESLLMAANVQLCSNCRRHPHVLTIAYFTLVVIGAMVQLILTRRKPDRSGQKELKALLEGKGAGK